MEIFRRLGVAKAFFICGDAAHLWVPMAGYGMNAGIDDAMNLSWQLDARLNGWAEEGVLSAYEAERQPITEQVSRFAMNHAIALQKEREGVPAGIEEAGPAGEEARRAAGRALYDLNVKQYGLRIGLAEVLQHRRHEPERRLDRGPHLELPGGRPPGAVQPRLGPVRLLQHRTGVGHELLARRTQCDALGGAFDQDDVVLLFQFRQALGQARLRDVERARRGPVAAVGHHGQKIAKLLKAHGAMVGRPR